MVKELKVKGRPVIKIDFNELQDLMRFYPTLEECASWFNCSQDTIERLIKKASNMTFAEFRTRFSGNTRLLLKRKAISMALEDGNQKMLLYCLEAMTDLKVKLDDEVPTEHVVRLAYSLD